MENVERSFHMAGGDGDNSYTKNSSLQKKSADDAKSLTREALRRVYQTTAPESMGIADLGCSSGPNTFSFVKDMVEEIERMSKNMEKPSPEFRVYLNDLPSNDFNSVFQALPDFYAELERKRAPATPLSLYIGAYPGSFYGRLFPDQSLHFIYSSASLHWLSRVPPGIYDRNGESINKGSVYITEESPPEVAPAYAEQFREDFSMFLNLRSKELVAGGGMVLILLGRNGPGHLDRGTSFLWEMLSRSFAALVLQGKVEEEKFNSYEVHFYAPSKGEIEELVRKEESLKLERLELLEMEMPKDLNAGGISYGTKVAMATRAIQGSMISHHFGQDIMNNLFEVYGGLIDEEVEKQDFRPTISVVVVRKL